jgi:hypothetical protein
MMKKSLSAAIMLAAATFGYAQVGINTSTPSSTLDITAKNSTGTSKNVDGLLVPRVDRERAQSMSSIPTSTLIYVNSINKGTQTGNAVNVDAVGYYYFDGNVWVKLNAGSGSGTSVNIYNSDGTLTGNRTVTQGDKTLTFNGTATNAFSVDGKTFSVDAANDRVGIGTDAPLHKFHVVTSTASLNRFSLIDGPSSTNSTPILALRNTSPSAAGNLSLLGFTNSGPASGGANWGIGSIVRPDNKEDFYFGNSIGAGYLERMRLTSEGNLGVNTTAPTNTLDVNGTARVRTMNSAPKNTLITSVYADANGVLVKANPSNINQLITNSVQVAPGATGTLISGLPIGSMFKVAITIYDGCTNTGLAEYYVGMSGKGINAINAISGMLMNNSSSPNFTKANATTTKTVWTGKGGCQSGGDSTNFDYTVSVPVGGTITIQNNGNMSNEYYVVVTRMDPI